MKIFRTCIVIIALWLSSCSMHDGKGWEHDPDSDARQDSSSIFEHKH